MKTVLTVGVYDLMHFGHIELFRKAKELAGDNGRLVVAVQRDDIVSKYKPTAKLIYNWDMRAKMVSAIRYVDAVVPYDDIDTSIKEIHFDIFAKGGDQNHDGFKRAVEWCNVAGKEVVTLPRTEGISTTKLKEILKGGQ